MPPLFSQIGDVVLKKLEKSLLHEAKLIRDFNQALGIKSYKDLGTQPNKDALAKMEEALGRCLTHPLRSSPKKASTEALATWVEAYQLMTLWQRSIHEGAILTTLPLKTFPKYQVDPLKPTRAKAHKLAKALGLTPLPSGNPSTKALELIKRREAVILHIKKVLGLKGSEINQTHKDKLRRILLPLVPLPKESFEVVILSSMVYLCLPRPSSLKETKAFQKLSPKDQTRCLSFLKEVNRVRFEQFSQFPGLSRFEGREAAPSFLKSLHSLVSYGMGDSADLLGSCVMFADIKDIEKYLIHDSYGHVWQGSLTPLPHLYDQMVACHLPLSVDQAVTLKDGRVITMVDLFFVKSSGELKSYPELAKAYFHAILEEKITAAFAPIIAELTADMIEYKFIRDHGPEHLPSSSLFKDRSTKVDFAWTDLSYFLKVMRKSESLYHKDPRLVEDLARRILTILKFRHPHSFRLELDEAMLQKKLTSHLKRLLKDYLTLTHQHLDPHLTLLEKRGAAHINCFFSIYINLLRIQATINNLTRNHLEKHPGWRAYHEWLCLFIVLYFAKNPAKNFFNLDETLAQTALLVFKTLNQIENPGR